MNKEDIIDYLNKKIKLVLISGSYFTGVIIKINDSCLHMTDKFDQHVVINLEQISNIIEIKGDRK